MSATGKINAVQTVIETPKLSDINPLNSEDPLIQSLKDGELPSNKVLTGTLDKLKDTLVEEAKNVNLDAKGEQLLDDMTSIIDSAEKILEERNKGDQVQNLLRDSASAAKNIVSEVQNTAQDVSDSVKGAVKDTVKSVLPSPVTIAATAISSAASIASGASTLADSASNVANQVVSGFASGVPAIGNIGTVISESLARSNLIQSLDLPSASEAKGDAKEALSCGRQLVVAALKSGELRDLLAEIADFLQGVYGDASEKVSELSDAVKMDIDQGNKGLDNTADTLKEDALAAKDSVLASHPIQWTDEVRQEYYAKFSSLAQRISEKPEYKRLLDLYWKWMDEIKSDAATISEAAKEKAGELKEKAMEKGSELKDQAIEKAAEAKDKAVAKANEVKDMAVDKANEVKDAAKEQVNEKSIELKSKVSRDLKPLDKVWNDITALVDSFAGQGSFESFVNNWWLILGDIFEDQDLTAYYGRLKAFVVDAINDPQSLKSKEKTEEGNRLLSEGRELFGARGLKGQFSANVNAGKNILHKIATDNLTNDFAEKLRRFGEHFVMDARGRPDLYVLEDSLGQIRKLVFPILSHSLANLTIDRVVGNSDNYDWEIQNLLISLPDVIPEHFDLRTKNHLAVDVKGLATEKNITKIILEVSKIKPQFHGVKFWYKRKSFPHIEDSGVADVDLSEGQGTKVKVIWKIKSKNNRPYTFSLMQVKCIIDKMDVKIKDAKHDILDRMASTLFIGSLKQAVAQGIVDQVVGLLEPLNDSMNQWFTTRPIGSIEDKIQEALNDKMQDAFDASKKLAQLHPIDRAVDLAKDQISGITQKVVDVKDAAVSGIEFAKETASATKEMLADKGIDIKDSAIDLATNVKEGSQKAIEKAGELKDQAVKKGTELYENAGEYKEMAIEKGSELADAALKKGSELKDQALEKGAELKKKAEKAAPEVAKKAGELKDQAIEKGTELKDKAVEKGTELKEKAEKAAPELAKKAEKAKDQALEKGAELKEQASEVADKAMKKGSELKDQALEKGAELKDAALKKGSELKDQASDAANKAAKKGSELKEQAVEKGEELKEQASGAAKKAAKKGSELKDQAVEKGEELKEQASEVADKAMKKGEELKDQAVEKGAELKKKVEKAVPGIADKAEELKDEAVKKGSELKKGAEKLAEKAVDEGYVFMEEAEDTAANAKKKATELKNQAVKKGTKMAQDAAKKGSQLKDKAVEKGAELKEKADEAMPDAMELADSAADKASEIAKQATDKASELAKDATEKAGKLKDKASGKSEWNGSWQKPKRKVRSSVSAEQDRPGKKAFVDTENPFDALSSENLAQLPKEEQKAFAAK